MSSRPLQELLDLSRFGTIHVTARRPLALRHLDLHEFPNSDRIQLISSGDEADKFVVLEREGERDCRLNTGPWTAAAKSLVMHVPLQYGWLIVFSFFILSVEFLF